MTTVRTTLRSTTGRAPRTMPPATRVSPARSAVGLWIDHRKAVIVAVTDKGETTQLIVSNVEKQLGRIGGVRSTTPVSARHVRADDIQDRRFHGHLATYFDAVIAATRNAEAILIFGPGEAKVELRQRLEHGTRSRPIVGFETTDKMTDRQIAAKVWQYFGVPRPAGTRGAGGTSASVAAADRARSRVPK